MNTRVINYQSKQGSKILNVYYHRDTFWMTLESMSHLFNSDAMKVYSAFKEVIKEDAFDILDSNEHIEVISETGSQIVGNFYNLDVIIAIGYRLNPKEATEFRLWSLFVVKNYIREQAKMEYGVVGSLKKSFSRLLSA
jgi:hypothetical protein